MKIYMKALAWIALTISAVLLVLLFLPNGLANAASTWYVAPGGSDSNDCLSAGTPCATINAAIAKASSGDTVFALPGTYSDGTGETFPISVKPGIHLVGADRETTIIEGQDGISVIYVGSEVIDFGSDTMISDLTLQDGSIGIQIYSTNSHHANPTIERLKIRWNTVGIQMSTSETYEYGATISAEIADSLIISNTESGIYIHAYGYFSSSIINPVIHDSTIQRNGQYGIFSYAASVSPDQSTAAPQITNDYIAENGSHGIFIQSEYAGWSWPSIDQSEIIGNGGYGFFYDQPWNSGVISGTLTNTAIISNTSGGVYIDRCTSYHDAGSIRIINNTIYNNGKYGVYWVRDGWGQDVIPTIVNTILWNPFADDLYSTGTPWSTAYIGYSDIEDGDFDGENGNFNDDPLLWDDVHLSSCSPMIDKGTSTNIPPVDIDGEARPIGAAADVGADEVQKKCLLTVGQQVSPTNALVNDTLTFEFTITPTQVTVPISLVLTDTLPVAISLDPDSLWASGGVITPTSDGIIWTGSIAPAIPVSLGFQANANRGNLDLLNYAQVDAGQDGKYSSPHVKITIGKSYAYVPFASKPYPSRGIYGTVNFSGSPAKYRSLELRFYNGVSWSTLANTGTDSNGIFSFVNIPGLSPGQYYYVRYSNSGYDTNTLWTWHTRLIDNYFSNQELPIGDFDIANIYLLSPEDGGGLGMPATFTWIPRPATPSDSYEFNLYDWEYGDPYFYTDPPLGHVGSYTFYSLPPEFMTYTWYVWEIWVYSPDGGYGISYEARYVYFYSSNMNIMPDARPSQAGHSPDIEGTLK
jgi:Protein of unknown function (DUF1565)